MPRYKLTQKWKNEKGQQRRWDLPPGSHVWCYLRHSPGDNQTIDSQAMGMREWCAANGWTIDRVFTDEAIEGSREDREQFQEMMSLSRQDARLVDGIAVWSFSRFARDQLDSQFYKAELRKRGYVVVSKIDDVPSEEMAHIYEAFIDWKNQFEQLPHCCFLLSCLLLSARYLRVEMGTMLISYSFWVITLF